MTDYKNGLTASALAEIGGGSIAYIRTLNGAQARGLFPSMPEVAQDLELWAPIGAAGTPIMLADTREALVENASDSDLTTVSIH